MHGPGYDPGAPYYYAPTWPNLPAITVYDNVAATLNEKRRAKWVELVFLACDEWEKAGISLIYVAGPGDVMAPGMTDQDFQDSIVPGTLTLVRLPALYGGTALGAGGWWPATDPGSIAALYVGNVWWRNITKRTRRIITTHEMGHALGLKHNTEGISVMDGHTLETPFPNLHDVESLEAYYAPNQGP